MDTTFTPYRIYRINIQQIIDFEQITKLSYGIAQQLLFRYPQETLSNLKLPKPQINQLSYTPADLTVTGVEEKCRWVNLDEYADFSGKTLDEIQKQVDANQLGPIEKHPESGETLIIYPEAFHALPRAQLPEIGKKKYCVSLKTKATVSIEFDALDTTNFEATQQQFLHLAHAVGKPTEVGERAEEMLYRSCLILYWTAFEVFIRSTVHELFRQHPEVIASGKRGKSNTITYEELLNLSCRFSDAEALRASLVERAIEREESEGRSVHGLINLLKSEFRFEDDPYSSWYVLNGERQKTTYTELMMVKDTRNALLHDAGQPNSELFAKYPVVPSRDGNIAITQDFYKRCSLTLDSISYKIANIVEKGRYKVQP